MDINSCKTLTECLSKIETLEESCLQKFGPSSCKNIKGYYRYKCHKMFEKIETSSSDKIFGGNTLNLINKSPDPSL